MGRSEDKVIKVIFPSQHIFYIEISFLLKQDLFSWPWSACLYGN